MGRPKLHIPVPADTSSAAFPIVAALITPGSDIVVEERMTNPLRTGLITTLMEMGADMHADQRAQNGGEVCRGVLRVRHIGACAASEAFRRNAAPAMIDEYSGARRRAAFAGQRTPDARAARIAGDEVRADRLQAVSEASQLAGRGAPSPNFQRLPTVISSASLLRLTAAHRPAAARRRPNLTTASP